MNIVLDTKTATPDEKDFHDQVAKFLEEVQITGKLNEPGIHKISLHIIPVEGRETRLLIGSTDERAIKLQHYLQD